MSAAHIANADRREGPRCTERAGGRSGAHLQLDVLREVLSTMETLTEPGQRYTMAKMVAFIAGRIPSSGLRLSERNEATVNRIVGRLAQESTGIVVDVARFCSHARALFDLLEALAPRRDVLETVDGTGRSRGVVEQRPPSSL